MDALQTLAVALPLSFACGLRFYATVLVLGLCIRFGWIQGAPPSFEIFAWLPIIIAAGLFYAAETASDFFPWFDNLWDGFHTLIRPPAAALLAVGVTWGELDPLVAVLAAIGFGGVGFVSHAAKTGTHLFLNVHGPTENVTNVVAGRVEDGLAAGLTVLAFKVPYWAAGATLVLLAVAIFVLPKLLRWGFFNVWTTPARLLATFRQKKESDVLSVPHLVLLDHEVPLVAARCKARKIRWVAGRSGYLSVGPRRVAFTYRKWFILYRAWQLPLEKVQAGYFRRGWFIDELDIHWKDDKGKPRVARFMFTRYRSPLAEELGRRLSARGLPSEMPEKVIEGRSVTLPA